MQVHPYLMFDGRCAEALAFYQQAVGAQIGALFKHGESPMCGDVPPSFKDKVMHSEFSIGAQTLFACDAPPEMFEQPQGFSISLNVDTGAEAERLFAALAEGATVTMPITETFWAERFGALTDRFGTPWMVNGGVKEIAH